MRRDGIYFVGAGVQTPMGRSMLTAAATVRCGMCGYAEHPSITDAEEHPLMVGMASWLDASMPVPDRLVHLGVGAAREALGSVPGAARAGWLGLHLALSEQTLTESVRRREIANRLVDELGLAVADPLVEVVTGGHASGLAAVREASHRLALGEVALCLVGGVDSYLDPERLRALEREGRIRSPRHRWGFTPSEGAGFCLMTTGATARHLGLTPLAELVNVAIAKEPKPMGTRTVCIGEGLTEALAAVLDPERLVTHGYCDLNGEPHRADELGFAMCRLSECIEDPGSFTTPVATWGDMGSASATLNLTLPMAAWARGYARGSVHLVWGSSGELPLRAAAVLARVPSA